MDEATDGQRLGAAILALRRVRRETQERLARRAGVSGGWLSMLERGQIARPTQVTTDAVAQALGFRDANDLLRAAYGHDGYARRRPRGYRRVARGRPEDQSAEGEGPQAPPGAAARGVRAARACRKGAGRGCTFAS
jgi:transcriptional regulator with XRE-family HTH domain